MERTSEPTVGRPTRSRWEFLKLGGAGLANLAVLGIAAPVLATGETTVSAHSLGLRPANPPRENRERLVGALADSNRRVVFGPGDYRIDNSGTTPPIIRNFGGVVRFEPGARLVFTNNRSKGLVFQGGTGAAFYGLRTTFSTPPPGRVTAKECLHFVMTTDTLLQDVTVNGSAAAGILFGRSHRPVVKNATIRNTRADGLHFANCLDPRVDTLLTVNTGDDGLAFVDYGGSGDYARGGYATNVTVKRSGTRGIAVVGQRDVTISGFSVDTTVRYGLLCAKEFSYGTGTPRNIRFEHGKVVNAGDLGVHFHDALSCAFANIDVISPATRGVYGTVPAGGEIRLENIEVRGATGPGFDIYGGEQHLDDCRAMRCGGTGFHHADARLVRYGRIYSYDNSQTNDLRRALSLERNDEMRGVEAYIVDEQTRPTGYTVNASGRQSGSLGRIYDRVLHGKVRVMNSSGVDLHQ